MTRRIGMTLCALWLAVSAAACMTGVEAGDGATALTGNWISADGTELITFNEGGRFTGLLKYGPSQPVRDVAGAFRTDGARILFRPDADYPMTWRVERNDQALAVTYVSGGAVKTDGATGRFIRKAPARD